MAQVAPPLSSLTDTERRLYQLGDLFAGRLKFVSIVWSQTFMQSLLWACAARRCRIQGAEHFAQLGPDDRVLLLSNHRSFFDFFTLTYVLFNRSRIPRRAFFPVRSTFFYEGPVGAFVNMAMGGMAMFPPIMRDSEKLDFNLYALARVGEELRKPGTLVGLHPEGARGKGEDPYELLPAQLGVGKVMLDADGATILPVFIIGLGNSLPREFVRNWFDPKNYPIDIQFGEPLDIDDLIPSRKRVRTQKRAADRVAAAIAELGLAVRARRGDSPLSTR